MESHVRKCDDALMKPPEHCRRRSPRQVKRNYYEGGGDPMAELKATMNDLRHRGELCDGEICCGPYRFPIHKAFLAAHSPYFRARFTINMKDSGQIEVISPAEEPLIMATVLEFIYTHKVNLTYRNVWEILPVADRLLVADLKEACSHYLAKQIRSDNALKILEFADRHNCNDVFHKVETYILHNFPIVAKASDEFLSLTHEGLLEFLDDSRLRVSSEEELYEAVMLWVKHNRQKRQIFLPSLLRRVRMAYISLEYFRTQILNDPHVANQTDCASLLSEARQLIEVISRGGGELLDLRTGLARPRVPRQVMFAICGWSQGSPISSLETYDVRANRWYRHEDLADVTRAYHGMAVLNDCIYILGGFDGLMYYNSMRRFDPKLKMWFEAAPMYQQRCYVAVATLGGVLYACGGYDGRARMRSVESYDPNTNQWSLIADMQFRRSDAGACALGDYVYVAGGYDGTTCLDSVERYSPKTGQWTLTRALLTARSGVSIITCKGAVYAIGGFNGEDRLHTAERFNPDTTEWQAISPMTISRSNFATALLEDQIYVLGGFDGLYTVTAVECYDPAEDLWRTVADMSVSRSALKAAVLVDLPNATDYTFHGNFHKDWATLGFDDFLGEEEELDEYL